MPACPAPRPRHFGELTAKAASRMEIVVNFLGLLELYKQGLVELEQVSTFGELRISWTGGLEPSAEEAEEDPEAPVGLRQPVSVSFGNLDYSGWFPRCPGVSPDEPAEDLTGEAPCLVSRSNGNMRANHYCSKMKMNDWGWYAVGLLQ